MAESPREMLNRLRSEQQGTPAPPRPQPESRRALLIRLRAEAQPTPVKPPFSLANVGTGAKLAALDIGAGVSQIAERYLPLSAETKMGLREKQRKFAAEKERDLGKPGAKVGYYGAQLATALIPVGGGSLAAVKGASKLGTIGKTITSGANAARAAKLIAPGVAQATLQPHETESGRAGAAALAAGAGAAFPAVGALGSKIIGKIRGGAPVGKEGKGAIDKYVRRIQSAPESAKTGELLSASERLGVTLTPGKIAGGTPKYLEEQFQKLPGSRKLAQSEENASRESFHRAVAKEIGVDLGDKPYIFSSTVEQARKDIGARLGDIWKQVRVGAGTEEAHQIKIAARKMVKPFEALVSATIPKRGIADLKNIRDGVFNALDVEGSLGGAGISALRTHLREISEKPTLHSAVRKRISDFESQLEELAQKSLRGTDPGQYDALTKANHQYANSKLLEKAVGDVEGFISGPKLYGAIKRKYKDPSHAGDFGKLGEIGERFFRTLPDSGTADRIMANEIIRTGGGFVGNIVGGALGGGAAYASGGGDPSAGVVGTAAGLLAGPRLAAQLYYRKPGAFLKGSAKVAEGARRTSALAPGLFSGGSPAAGRGLGGRESTPSGIKFVKTDRAASKKDISVRIDTNKFDKGFLAGGRDYYVGEGGTGEIKGRAKEFGEFLKKGKPIEMPEVSIDSKGAVHFVNGRHRYAYLRDNGIPIQVTMDADSLRYARKFGLAGGKLKE